jgi:hypothetical protein
MIEMACYIILEYYQNEHLCHLDWGEIWNGIVNCFDMEIKLSIDVIMDYTFHVKFEVMRSVFVD